MMARLALIGGLAAGATACSQMSSPSAPSAAVADTAPSLDAAPTAFGEELALCADEVNRYRASIGRPPLTRSHDLEAFATQASNHDGSVHTAHQYFRQTNGGGTAKAETEILWWQGFAVKAVVQKGLAQMWQVGPGGEHYEIIAGAYTQVGCGIFVNGSEVTVTQDFR
jgi:hypothetical protein